MIPRLLKHMPLVTINNLALQVVMFAMGSGCGVKKQDVFIQEERLTFKVNHDRLIMPGNY
jgi:hypothetical protein